MKLMLFVAVVLCFLGSLALGDTIPQEESEDAGRMWDQPRVLGQHRGKEFAAGSPKLNWYESLVYCYRKGYIPLTIEDQKDVEWIAKQSLASGFGPTCGFWTSGTDFPVTNVFTWYHTRIFVDTKALGAAISRDVLRSCLALETKPRNGSRLYDHYCLKGKLFPLCEKRVST